MSDSRVIPNADIHTALQRAVERGIKEGATGMALEAAAGALGAALLNYFGLSGCIVSEAGKMGLAGGVLGWGGNGAIAGFFYTKPATFHELRVKKRLLLCLTLNFALFEVFGMLGFGLMNSNSKTEMPFGQSCASFSLGSFLVLLSLLLMANCIEGDQVRSPQVAAENILAPADQQLQIPVP